MHNKTWADRVSYNLNLQVEWSELCKLYLISSNQFSNKIGHKTRAGALACVKRLAAASICGPWPPKPRRVRPAGWRRANARSRHTRINPATAQRSAARIQANTGIECVWMVGYSELWVGPHRIRHKTVAAAERCARNLASDARVAARRADKALQKV